MRRSSRGPPATGLPEYIEKYAEQIEDNGWTAEGFADDYSEPIRVRPERLRAW